MTIIHVSVCWVCHLCFFSTKTFYNIEHLFGPKISNHVEVRATIDPINLFEEQENIFEEFEEVSPFPYDVESELVRQTLEHEVVEKDGVEHNGPKWASRSGHLGLGILIWASRSGHLSLGI